MSLRRAKILVQGAVQGVGFRPFVYRLATELGLAGTVSNSNRGVDIEVEGEDGLLQTFINRLEEERPPRSSISKIERSSLAPCFQTGFQIGCSQADGVKSAVVLPDSATCVDCLREIFDPGNRRYLYPFTNCTNCGPRFSIIEAVPYDRANTSMKRFTMCPLCEQEYQDASGRRFHAQPNACATCGPQLELWDSSGGVVAKSETALLLAAQAIRAGSVVAVKGMGGFQLLADARNLLAVALIRTRKQRPEKPFAVMFPTLESVEACCAVSEIDRNLLISPEAPIVILQRADDLGRGVVSAVAPDNPRLGVMLPYSPLHHLLMRELEFPIVATSGNLSDEPICTTETEAINRLRGIADLFLVHDRPVVRPVDDSVVQVVMDRPMILRRARGYAPLPFEIEVMLAPILALGGHLKNTVAIATGNRAFVSQHIGNLETEPAHAAFRKLAVDLPTLYEARPKIVARDLHPDYFSTIYAQDLDARIISVQHHYAHVLSCMAEHGLKGPVLGIAWDGTGLGEDGTIWGGEFLLVNKEAYERVAHFRQFRLPGGETSVKEPRRSALGVLYEIFGEEIVDSWCSTLLLNFSADELRILKKMLTKRVNAPPTSSAGRLFDAVAALIGLRQTVTFEGQAAMALEFAIEKNITATYSFDVGGARPFEVDWEPAILEVIREIEQNVSIGVVAAKFHNGLAATAAAVAEKIRVPHIVLTGGCFQNKYLIQATRERLVEAGFKVHWHGRIPPNDGGLALGQIVAAARFLESECKTTIDASHANRTSERLPLSRACAAVA